MHYAGFETPISKPVAFMTFLVLLAPPAARVKVCDKPGWAALVGPL